MNDRNNRYGPRDYSGGNYGSGRDEGYSSARDYAAAGEGRRQRSDYGAGAHRDDERWGQRDMRYGSQTRDWGSSDGAERNWADRNWTDRERPRDDGNHRSYADRDRMDRSQQRDTGPYGGRETQGSRDPYRQRDNDQDRGFFERAGDEVRAWFGDSDAERRRERDQRYDAQHTADGDGHYHSWRRQRIDELDRDYDEYRRENAQRFHDEFSGWRTERQTQRDSLARVIEHMDVVGSDGAPVGTVDKVRGDRIVLTKSDAQAAGHHHSIPSRWIQSVEDKVTLRKTADEAQAHWKDEERSGAMFGQTTSDDASARTAGNLNRSFSGT